MKKIWWILVIVGIIVIILVVFGIYKYSENKKIKEANKEVYNYLVCLSSCPVEEMDNVNVFSEACRECNKHIDKVPQDMFSIPSNEKYGDKFVLNSEEHLSCLPYILTESLEERDAAAYQESLEERDAAAYQSCLKRILSEIKEKYGL